MRVRFVRRKVLLVAAAVAAGLVQRVLRPKLARADFFGGDLPILAAILVQATNTVVSLGNMLANLAQQVEAMHTMLSKLDPASLDALLGVLSSTEFSLGELTADTHSIGYTLQSVNSEFRAVYPSDYSRTSFAEFDSLYGRWQGEVLAASHVAARSQATLSTLQNNTDQASAILARSNHADGQVAQMQAIVQMLGLTQSQNNSVLQSLATTGRVLTSAAASTAAREQLSREKKKRNLANYRFRGDPVPPITKLP